MKYLIKITVLVLALFICRNVDETFSQNNSGTVEFYTPNQVISGQQFPIALRLYSPDGTLLSGVDGEYMLRITSTESVSIPFLFTKGAGYLLTSLEAESEYVLSVDGFQGEKSIHVSRDRITVTHGGTIADTGETWDDTAYHVITDDVSVPENCELVIGQGTTILLKEKGSITVNGTIRITGTETDMVLISSADQDKPWGGIEIINGLGEFSYCLFTQGGGDQSKTFGHSNSQPVLYTENGDTNLNNCFLIENTGKGIGGSRARITIKNSLIAKCDTGGECANSVTTISDSHILDIPDNDGCIEDDDNDGFYFNGIPQNSDESSLVENSYIVNTEDDGIDHNGARLNIINCWIENCLHEGLAASNAGHAVIYNSLIKRCEQGVEAGYGNPEVTVDHCVLIENDIGLRFGDSYDWGCTGTINVSNTILYGNDDNILNYDIKTGGPLEKAITISYSMTNDEEFDGSQNCTNGIPEFDSEYFLLSGSPGIGEGINGNDMGRISGEEKPQLIINEILALNSSFYCDEFGEYDDWIELFNHGSQPVNIAGMYITDDMSDPTKWRIPDEFPSETEIQSGEYLIVWMDDNTEQGPLHVDAKLSGSGEQVALYTADGETLIDMVTFGQQQENVSYGRVSDGSEEWTFFDIPTPGFRNDFIDIPSVKEYFITCDPDSFAYIYENYESDTLIPITLSHGSRYWSDLKMRIRGDTSRKYPKKSLRLEFYSQPFSNGRNVLIFNAEYFDQSYIHQYLSSNLFRESGYPCFTAEYARLYLNGEFLGLYLRIDNIDEDFLESVNLDPDGDLYKATKDGACMSIFDDIEYHWEKKTNTQTGTTSLETLIESLNSTPDNEYYNFARDVFDYDKMIDIIAINMLIVNASTYYHNYYMYQDVNSSGKWTMLPWDMDKTSSSYSWEYPYNASAWSNYRTPDNPFMERALICDPIFEDIKARIGDLHDTFFNPNHITPIADSLKALLEPSVIEDKTDNIDSVEEWEKLIDINLTFIDERYNILQQQFTDWPTSFTINRPEEDFSDEVFLSWRSSTDPNGDAITYTLKYSTEVNFPEDKTTTFTGLTDTTYTLPSTPTNGTYYWSVFANDGMHSVEGFDSRNIFIVNRKTVLPDTINVDTKLNMSGSPYLASGDLNIEPGVSLTVEPGVIIQMPAAASIYIYGGLKINGTKEAPVTITSVSENERWGALCFINSDGNASVSYTVIENSSENIDKTECNAAISGISSVIALSNISFNNVQQAVSIIDGDCNITNCSFSGDNEGEQILVKNATVSIENCSFDNIGGGDIIDFEHVSNGVITNCIIQSSEDDGIDIGNGCQNIFITNVDIYDCSDKGISVGQNSEVTIERSIVSQSNYGIAVFNGSQAFIDHVTLYGNDIALALYQNEDYNGGGTAEVWNSILADSGNKTYSADEHSQVTFGYCLSDKIWLPGQNNIQDNPLFINAKQNDFRLLSDSPCVDTGDPNSALDPDGSRSDIGADYFSRSSIVINEINYNSSPLMDSGDWIELYNIEPHSVNISGWILMDENDDHVFVIPEDVIIDPEGCVVLCNNVADFLDIYPEVTSYIGNIGFGLSGSGELIRLYNSKKILVDSLTYGDSSPWPEEADGYGSTLSLINPSLDNAVAHNWDVSSDGGTPGKKNDVYANVGDSWEFLVRPFNVGQNFPNPFNNDTVLPVTILERCRIKITLYSILGQKVDTIFNGYLNNGTHNIEFDGDIYSSGIYFYMVTAGKYIQTRSMTLIK